MYPVTSSFFHTPALECSPFLGFPLVPISSHPSPQSPLLLPLSPASALPLFSQLVGAQFWFSAFHHPIYNPGHSFVLGSLSLVPFCVRSIISTGIPYKEPLSYSFLGPQDHGGVCVSGAQSCPSLMETTLTDIPLLLKKKYYFLIYSSMTTEGKGLFSYRNSVKTNTVFHIFIHKQTYNINFFLYLHSKILQKIKS